MWNLVPEESGFFNAISLSFASSLGFIFNLLIALNFRFLLERKLFAISVHKSSVELKYRHMCRQEVT